jgi:hypothetical protein
MKKYIVLYTAPIEAMQQMAQTTSEEQAKGDGSMDAMGKKVRRQIG